MQLQEGRCDGLPTYLHSKSLGTANRPLKVGQNSKAQAKSVQGRQPSIDVTACNRLKICNVGPFIIHMTGRPACLEGTISVEGHDASTATYAMLQLQACVCLHCNISSRTNENGMDRREAVFLYNTLANAASTLIRRKS